MRLTSARSTLVPPRTAFGGGQMAVADGLVDDHLAPGDGAGGEDVGHGGAKLGVHPQAAALVGIHPGGGQVESGLNVCLAVRFLAGGRDAGGQGSKRSMVSDSSSTWTPVLVTPRRRQCGDVVLIAREDGWCGFE